MEKYGEEPCSFTYDVFLSFRGEDTRHIFIAHLRRELRLKGISTFLDDENLRIGEGISPALCKAIEESRILIVVLSENYASSRWCLDELVKILDCTKRNNKQLVFPIFYNVDPSDVRHQKNRYRQAMNAHEDRFGKDSEKVQAWRSALSEVANLKGQHIRTGYEINFIEKIAKEVNDIIATKPLHIDQNPVGLESRTEEVKLLLDMKPNDDTVCMLGIYGAGGIGKTALAQALYNKIAHQFEAASFLANVREKSNKINGIEDLQKTLLSDMLETELGSTSKGINEIKGKLHRKKVLLVLDDVDDKEILEKLAGGCDWFGSGSRVIITTRDKDLLIAHQVENIYKMTELNDQHSLELFCWNAFKKSYPPTGYEDLSSRAVGYAQGLPLALKVIGSDLAMAQSLDAWESALKEYERIPKKSIQNVLKISFDRLEEHAQQVFLDIACFFKGERVESFTKILEEFGATFHIKVLANKSLLTVEYGCLNMHDLIQDMGREIVRQEAPSNPGQRSRLWFYEDVLEVLAENSGSEKIEGIMLDPPQRKEVDWCGTAFKEMKRLRILIVRNTSFSSEPKHLPNHLRLLDWMEYPSKSFPPEFHPQKIIVFNLCKSNLILEEPFKKFSCLTHMNFSHSQYVTEMPNVSEVQNLIELRLDNCKNLIEVHESVGFLKNLLHLSVSECTKLRNFLQRMFLPSLEVLDLNFCVRLEHFPDVVEKMNKPLKIYMINTAIKELPDSIGNLIGLYSIEMPSSRKLRYLPSSLFMLPNVVAFKIGGCPQLRESFTRFIEGPSAAEGRSPLQTLYFENGGLSDEDLHAVLNCFPKLEELIASENNFVSLPACIKESVHLTSLDVSVCKNLKKIPECTDLRILDVHLCVKLEDISDLPSTIQKVDARYCSLSSETSTMLWSQVSKEIRGLEVVMPQTEIPEWFDFRGNGGNPRFWARGKFPIVALALVFKQVNEMAKLSRRQLVELHLVINGQCVPRKGYYNFRIAADHVLLCDLRLLFSDEEWHGLDAFLEHDWNQVQVSYEAESTLTLSCWGVFVYKQGTKVDDVQFMCPDPKFSDIANRSRTIIPTRGSKMEQIKMIESLALDQMFDGMLMETLDFEEREDFADKDFAIQNHHILMGALKELSKQSKDLLESNRPSEKACGKGSTLEENSTLAWLLEIIKKDDDELKPRMDVGEASSSGHQGNNWVELKPPMDVGEASSSGHQGSGSDPQQEDIMMGIFWEGMEDGLLEAQNCFPSLDIQTTICAALNKGNRVAWSLPESGVEHHEGEGLLLLPQVEMKIYIEGIFNGLLEAKLSFPTLDIDAILKTVLSRGNHKGPIEAPPVIQQVYSSSDDPLLQAFMMMKPESWESEAKSKLYWKLKEEHKALRQRFEEFENETVDPNNDSDTASCWKNQYDELLEKFNPQSAEFVSKKHGNLDGTDDAEAKATKISDSNSAWISTEMHTAIGKGGCKGVAKYEKLAAVLKGRDEELRRLYDAGIVGFQNSEEFQDLMSAIYLNGLRDGILEAQAIVVALDMKNEKHVTDEEDAKEEHVTDEVAKEVHVTDEAAKEEHVTNEVAKEKHIEAVDNENLDETIGVADIPGPAGPEVYNPPETSNPSSSEVLVDFEESGHMFF